MRLRQLRKDQSPDAPAGEEDFCTCPRGREALRWWLAGNIAMPALLEELGDCEECAPDTGVFCYEGWRESTGGGAYIGHLAVRLERRQ